MPGTVETLVGLMNCLRPLHIPGRAGVGEDGAGDDARTVHFPDGDSAARILPCDVGMAVAVVVVGACDVPTGPRIAETGGADHTGPVHLPDRRLAAVVLPQNVGAAVVVEIAGPDDVPARPRV